MKLNKLNIILAVLVVAAIVGAIIYGMSDRERPYTITGTLDLPEQIPYGDTVITVPSFEDTWVYMLDLENNIIDSVQIQDNKFQFLGTIRAKDAYYVQLASQLGHTLLVIEPGDIDVYIDPNFTVSGTPGNDALGDTDAALENLNTSTYDHLAQLTDSLRAQGKELSEAEQQQIGLEFQRTMSALLDSLYAANQDNLGAQYIVLMRHMDATSSELFEEALSHYPEHVRNGELLQFNLRMIRQYESMYSGEMNNSELDSLLLDAEMPQSK